EPQRPERHRAVRADDAEAPRLQALPDLPGQRQVSARQSAVGLDRADQAGAGGDVRPEVSAGVLAEPEPDRAVVEVPAQGGVAEVAPDVRGHATGHSSRAGQPAQARAGAEDVDDRAVPPEPGSVHHNRGQRRPLTATPPPGTSTDRASPTDSSSDTPSTDPAPQLPCPVPSPRKNLSHLRISTDSPATTVPAARPATSTRARAPSRIGN